MPPLPVVDLNNALDRALRDERRPDERLRMLRQTTNQITRGANDAIQANRRASAAVHAELHMPGGDSQQAHHLRLLLDAARADLLRVLEVTSHRYAWAELWRPSSGRSHPAAAKDVGRHGP